MKNILIVSGHPDLANSVASATILDYVAKALPQAEIRRLDSLYPTYQFDIAAEQQAVQNADIIVWQFPFSWYSVPGLMKLWIDKVFVHGFAHGSTAKLGGKKLVLSFTTGAPNEAYQPEGFFGHNVEDYLVQFQSTAQLCSLEYQTPVYTCGISYVGRNPEAIKAQQELAKKHAERLIEQLKALAE